MTRDNLTNAITELEPDIIDNYFAFKNELENKKRKMQKETMKQIGIAVSFLLVITISIILGNIQNEFNPYYGDGGLSEPSFSLKPIPSPPNGLTPPLHQENLSDHIMINIKKESIRGDGPLILFKIALSSLIMLLYTILKKEYNKRHLFNMGIISILASFTLTYCSIKLYYAIFNSFYNYFYTVECLSALAGSVFSVGVFSCFALKNRTNWKKAVACLIIFILSVFISAAVYNILFELFFDGVSYGWA